MSYQFGPIDPEQRAGYSGGAGAPERGRRGVLVAAGAVVVMALFAGGLWFAYKEGARRATGNGGVPLIRADRSPAKVKPSSPGGMKIPDQNMLIYNEIEPRVEHLLPPPEQPMPLPAPPPRPAPAAGAPPPATQAAAPAPQAPTAASAAPTAASPAPSARASAAPSPQTASAPPAAAATSPPAPPEPLRQVVAPRPELRPMAPERPAARMPPKAPAAGLRVQLGALRSASLARRQWEALRRKNASLLGGLTAETVRVDLGAKGVFYRIETGPLASPAAAARLCEELRRRNVGCILVR